MSATSSLLLHSRRNAALSPAELHDWIVRVMSENSFTYEILFINDGSTDNSWNVIEDLKTKNSNVRGIKFQRNYGKSAALHVGFGATKGDVVITMDADLQDSPDEIPELYKMIKEDGFDLVSGWKKKRYDPLSKTIPTKLYNGVNRMMSGIKFNTSSLLTKFSRLGVEEVVLEVLLFVSALTFFIIDLTIPC